MVYIGQKANYRVGKEIGIGGEGQVFDVINQPTLALKLYNQPISNEKAKKLKVMTSLLTPQIELYTAWPLDIIKDNDNQFCGFVMRKLKGYVPLHNLFSPMDRKSLFPDKGYNFLVHVARNLSSAFNALHASQLIVGDVNEANIFVDAKGMIAFIDCDSFQVKEGNHYHYCEVGIPRYTPPELLRTNSFTNVLRTKNTDSFSLAILLFQLLFLGRHPFAGKNNTTLDIDEEIAIKNYWFAYSLHPKQQNLVPPKDTFPFDNLSIELKSNFHQAFEEENNRPLPINWIVALDSYLKVMVNCIKSPVHIYPSTFNECPWCAFEINSKINYFVERDYPQNEPLTLNINQYIIDLKPEKLNFPKLKLQSKTLDKLLPLPISPQFIRYKQNKRILFYISIGIVLLMVCFNYWFALIGILASIILYQILPWKRNLTTELNKRKSEKEILNAQLLQYIETYNNPEEVIHFTEDTKQLINLLKQYKALPTTLQKLQVEAEERLYHQHLNAYLSHFHISTISIPESKINLLKAEGIENASHIQQLKTNKIAGIGSNYQKQLLQWQRQLISSFIYREEVTELNKEHTNIIIQTNRDKMKLENEIIQMNSYLKETKARILAKQQQLQITISIIEEKAKQADVDYQAFYNWLMAKK